MTPTYVSGTLLAEVALPSLLPLAVGVFGGAVLGLMFVAALFVLLKRKSPVLPAPNIGEALQSQVSALPSEEFAPIRSYLDPDDDEPSTPLPSQSMAPLSFARYVEVRGAIEGWTDAKLDVPSQLATIFGIEPATYREADAWWMLALEGADDRLREVERQVAVFAERYGGTRD